MGNNGFRYLDWEDEVWGLVNEVNVEILEGVYHATNLMKVVPYSGLCLVGTMIMLRVSFFVTG